MGLLDRIETKTMTLYQTFMQEVGISVSVSKVHCGNYKTVECPREHVCVSYLELGSRGEVLSFYRCAGELWMNRGDSYRDLGTIHLCKWGPNVWAEAAVIASFIEAHESTP